MLRKHGFTLVEIIIVVAIIGLLASIALPSFIKSRKIARKNACINNLRQISAAKEEYVLEHGGSDYELLVESNVAPYIKNMAECFCPSAYGMGQTFAQSYSINIITNEPTCRIEPTNAAGPYHSLASSPAQAD